MHSSNKNPAGMVRRLGPDPRTSIPAGLPRVANAELAPRGGGRTAGRSRRQGELHTRDEEIFPAALVLRASPWSVGFATTHNRETGNDGRTKTPRVHGGSDRCSDILPQRGFGAASCRSGSAYMGEPLSLGASHTGKQQRGRRLRSLASRYCQHQGYGWRDHARSARKTAASPGLGRILTRMILPSSTAVGSKCSPYLRMNSSALTPLAGVDAGCCLQASIETLHIVEDRGASFCGLRRNLKKECIIPDKALRLGGRANGRHFCQRRGGTILPSGNRRLSDADEGGELSLRDTEDARPDVFHGAHCADNMRKGILSKRVLSANAFFIIRYRF